MHRYIHVPLCVAISPYCAVDEAYIVTLHSYGLYSHGLYSHSPYSYGLYSHGLYGYGLCSHSPYSYGLYGYGLSSYGLYSYGLYSYGLYSYGLYSYGPPKEREPSDPIWAKRGLLGLVDLEVGLFKLELPIEEPLPRGVDPAQQFLFS